MIIVDPVQDPRRFIYTSFKKNLKGKESILLKSADPVTGELELI